MEISAIEEEGAGTAEHQETGPSVDALWIFTLDFQAVASKTETPTSFELRIFDPSYVEQN